MSGWRRLLRGMTGPLLAVSLALAWGGPARADLMITPEGAALGLSLSTFATEFPSSGGVGPLGAAFVGGTVVVSDGPGNVRVFPNDSDHQKATDVHVAQNYGFSNACDLAQVGSAIYMTRQAIGDLVQINGDGTFNQVIVAGLPTATGLIADPTNGHLFVSTIDHNVIYDVDPVAKRAVKFIDANLDGLAISADGTILYGASAPLNEVFGYDTRTGSMVFRSGFIGGGVDGTAVGVGPFSGSLFINTNLGQLYEQNLATHQLLTIATGGSRGDFLTIDPTTDTLMVTQTDRIMRLSGAEFVPEPSALALLAVGGVAAWLGRGRRRRPAAG